MSSNPGASSFTEYRRLIMADLQRLDRQHERLDGALSEVKTVATELRTLLTGLVDSVDSLGVRISKLEKDSMERLERVESAARSDRVNLRETLEKRIDATESEASRKIQANTKSIESIKLKIAGVGAGTGAAGFGLLELVKHFLT